MSTTEHCFFHPKPRSIYHVLTKCSSLTCIFCSHPCYRTTTGSKLKVEQSEHQYTHHLRQYQCNFFFLAQNDVSNTGSFFFSLEMAFCFLKQCYALSNIILTLATTFTLLAQYSDSKYLSVWNHITILEIVFSTLKCSFDSWNIIFTLGSILTLKK